MLGRRDFRRRFMKVNIYVMISVLPRHIIIVMKINTSRKLRVEMRHGQRDLQSSYYNVIILRHKYRFFFVWTSARTSFVQQEGSR